MHKMFYINYTDEDGVKNYPVIGAENIDAEGNPLMSDEMFQLYASDILLATARASSLGPTTRTWDIAWEEIDD